MSNPEELIPEIGLNEQDKIPKARTFEQGWTENTATSGFALRKGPDLDKEVNSTQEFAIKFIDTVERMLDIDPHRRDWQSAMIRLMKDAEKVLGGE